MKLPSLKNYPMLRAAIVALCSPFILSAVLVILKVTCCHGITWIWALAPIWFVALFVLLFAALLTYLSRWGQKEAKTPRCSKCTFYQNSGLCLHDMQQHSLMQEGCEHFLGSVLKGWGR